MEKISRISSVIRTAADAVLVFDIAGEQIPEYQGSYHEVREIICRDAPRNTLFAHWHGTKISPISVPRQEW
ncbi:MAG: hypothetical protein ABID87_01845 [Chloroflexota bacterium]